MVAVQFLCIYLFIGGAFCTEYFFSKLHGWKLAAEPFRQYSSLKEAFVACKKNRLCIGARKASENEFNLLLRPFTNVVATEWCVDYLYDRSNGTALKSAPHILDSKIIFGIYDYPTNPNCPYSMTEVNGRCQGTIGGEERCTSYPSYMNSSFDSKTGICSVVTSRDLIQSWM